MEASRSIDVNRLHRAGYLRAGWVGSWQWTCDGEKVASINLRAETDRLHLTYRVRIDGILARRLLGSVQKQQQSNPFCISTRSNSAKTCRGSGTVSIAHVHNTISNAPSLNGRANKLPITR